MKSKSVLVLLVVLSGCVSSQGFFYERKSGMRVDANPALFARFSDDKLQCDALSAEKALASNENDLIIHNRNVTLIYHACMARKGYDVRPN